jgi:hypothetical protein
MRMTMPALAVDRPAEALVSGTTSARILAFPGTCVPAGAPATLSAAERERLDRLRWFALKSRLAPKPDLERACFLLAGEANVSLERFATAFFRGLADKASREIALYRPGTRSVSDDEIWLIRLLEASATGQDSAARALVAWRVRPEARRWMRFLAGSLANAL